MLGHAHIVVDTLLKIPQADYYFERERAREMKIEEGRRVRTRAGEEKKRF
jgi:hypothetical protein